MFLLLLADILSFKYILTGQNTTPHIFNSVILLLRIAIDFSTNKNCVFLKAVRFGKKLLLFLTL